MSYSDDFIRQLALNWAPINYQYINLRGWKDYYYTKQDLLVPVNMEYYKCNEKDKEKSYDTKNMRKRLECVKIDALTPAAYYSFAATKNHFYLLYSFYHADDTSHPNDMEGCLVILERSDSKQKLLGMVTIAHGKRPKYSFNNNLFLNNGKQSKVDPMFVEDEGQNKHPLIQQESGKHGLYGLGHPWKLTQIWRWLKNIFGFKSDIIVYFPYKPAKPYCITDLIRFKGTTHYATFYYDLIDILKDLDDEKNKGFFHRRVGKGNKNNTFMENEKFYGNAANPPWLWEYGGIKLWDDPASLADKWFVPSKGGKPFRDESSSTGKIKYERMMNGENN